MSASRAAAPEAIADLADGVPAGDEAALQEDARLPASAWLQRIAQRRQQGQDRLARASLARHHSYNDAIDFIRHPPADFRIWLIHPPAGFRVGRMTTDPDKLEQGYQMGWQAAQAYLGTG